ncbi:MAG TPA: hypothetical protein VN207_11445, partial [Ktedonobacteraceae bacterium]|nr:hypothetical protein [Ktedonobacteraceae bacterium]
IFQWFLDYTTSPSQCNPLPFDRLDAAQIQCRAVQRLEQLGYDVTLTPVQLPNKTAESPLNKTTTKKEPVNKTTKKKEAASLQKV